MDKVIVFLLKLAIVAGIPVVAGDFAILNLRVVEGEGSVYGTGTRATRGITVEVVDEAGHPVPDVTVSFKLPEEGPSGTFNTGSKTEVVTTRQDGRVSVWGMRWNRSPGALQVRVTAVKDGVRAGLVSTQYLSEASAASAGGGGSVRRGHSKLILISLAVAGAAAGGVAMSAARGSAAPAIPPIVPLTIGKPSVIVGAP